MGRGNDNSDDKTGVGCIEFAALKVLLSEMAKAIMRSLRHQPAKMKI